tara:strand:+ start:49 stop:672 length:624 start_codon:yes stop_codon:yes gene_type:complete
MQSKFTLLVLSIFLYLAIFIAIYLVHINFFEVQVILYSALLDSSIALIIFGAISLSLKNKLNLNFFESVLIILLLSLIGYSLSLSLPTVIDRSLSFYFLEKIDQHDGSIEKASMRDIFINDYIDEYKLVEIRITEQLESGTIRLDGSCVSLTKRGYLISKFSNFFRKNLLANNRLILDEYSNQLTDPLGNSSVNKEYLCQNTAKKSS